MFSLVHGSGWSVRATTYTQRERVRNVASSARAAHVANFLPRLLGACLACAAPSAFAFNVYTVGIDADCQYSDIQAAIDAAAANPGEDYLFIQGTPTMRWGQQHVVITDQDVDIVGGFASCSDDEPTPGYQSSLQGESGHSVIEIEGASNVFMENLELFGASMDDSHQGGGIYDGADGTLTLDATWVHGNQTGYGGGIAMNPPTSSILVLQASTVSANTATVEGGGIRLNGPSVMYADSGSYITANTSDGAGGGIKLAAPASAYISSTVDLNGAEYGGGIAAYAVDDDPVFVSLYSSSATQPVSIYGNTAAHNGGGVYIKSSETAVASFCAEDFSIDANTVETGSGSAIYADTNNGLGSPVYINAPGCSTGASPFPAVPCPTGPYCNEIADNSGGGATVDIEEGGLLEANRFAARRNQGGNTIFVDTSVGSSNGLITTGLHDCLLVDNVDDGDVIELLSQDFAGLNTQLIVDTCTIAHNSVGLPYSIYAYVNYVEITNSIIYQPGANVLAFAGSSMSDLTAEYDLVNNASTLTTGGIVVGVLQGAPTFVDSTNGDYHLVRASQGVDYAPGLDGYDLDGSPRTVDLTDVPNVFGPMDLGPYEIQTQASGPCSAADTIFCNGFDGQ